MHAHSREPHPPHNIEARNTSDCMQRDCTNAQSQTFAKIAQQRCGANNIQQSRSSRAARRPRAAGSQPGVRLEQVTRQRQRDAPPANLVGVREPASSSCQPQLPANCQLTLLRPRRRPINASANAEARAQLLLTQEEQPTTSDNRVGIYAHRVCEPTPIPCQSCPAPALTLSPSTQVYDRHHGLSNRRGPSLTTPRTGGAAYNDFEYSASAEIMRTRAFC